MVAERAQVTPAVTTALEHAAVELRRFARNHKAAERTHRRLAQQGMQALERLRRECESAGIHLVIAEEAQTHDDHRSR